MYKTKYELIGGEVNNIPVPIHMFSYLGVGILHPLVMGYKAELWCEATPVLYR